MKRFTSLDRYQKGVLLFMAAMILVFAVIYSITISRVGFLYQDSILIPRQEKDATIYSGKIHRKPVSFTVYADNTVEVQYDDNIYGPYSVKEDPSAIPDGIFAFSTGNMTGMEVRHREEVIFRGGVLQHGEELLLYNEDGSPTNMHVSVITSDGIVIDTDGNIVDPMLPLADAIIHLAIDPELTHKGDWLIWLTGVLVCAVTALSILFADDLFRWNLRFQIRNADEAEPSNWEIASRYIGWTVLPLMALVLFIVGLQ